MQAKLRVVDGKASRSEVPLKLPVVIGRSSDATLKIKHKLISRAHCELYEKDGYLYLRDNGSLNGTYVAGQRISEVLLNPGDQFTVGPLTFEAVYDPPVAPPAEQTATIDMQTTLHSTSPGAIDFSSFEEAAVPAADDAPLAFPNFAETTSAAGVDATLNFVPDADNAATLPEQSGQLAWATEEPAAADAPEDAGQDGLDMSWLTGEAPAASDGVPAVEESPPEEAAEDVPAWEPPTSSADDDAPAAAKEETSEATGDEPGIDLAELEAPEESPEASGVNFSWLTSTESALEPSPIAGASAGELGSSDAAPAGSWPLNFGEPDKGVPELPPQRKRQREAEGTMAEFSPTTTESVPESGPPPSDESWQDQLAELAEVPPAAVAPDIAGEFERDTSTPTAVADEPSLASEDFGPEAALENDDGSSIASSCEPTAESEDWGLSFEEPPAAQLPAADISAVLAVGEDLAAPADVMATAPEQPNSFIEQSAQPSDCIFEAAYEVEPTPAKLETEPAVPAIVGSETDAWPVAFPAEVSEPLETSDAAAPELVSEVSADLSISSQDTHVLGFAQAIPADVEAWAAPTEHVAQSIGESLESVDEFHFAPAQTELTSGDAPADPSAGLDVVSSAEQPLWFLNPTAEKLPAEPPTVAELAEVELNLAQPIAEVAAAAAEQPVLDFVDEPQNAAAGEAPQAVAPADAAGDWAPSADWQPIDVSLDQPLDLGPPPSLLENAAATAFQATDLPESGMDESSQFDVPSLPTTPDPIGEAQNPVAAVAPAIGWEPESSLPAPSSDILGASLSLPTLIEPAASTMAEQPVVSAWTTPAVSPAATAAVVGGANYFVFGHSPAVSTPVAPRRFEWAPISFPAVAEPIATPWRPAAEPVAGYEMNVAEAWTSTQPEDPQIAATHGATLPMQPVEPDAAWPQEPDASPEPWSAPAFAHAADEATQFWSEPQPAEASESPLCETSAELLEGAEMLDLSEQDWSAPADAAPIAIPNAAQESWGVEEPAEPAADSPLAELDGSDAAESWEESAAEGVAPLEAIDSSEVSEWADVSDRAEAPLAESADEAIVEWAAPQPEQRSPATTRKPQPLATSPAKSKSRWWWPFGKELAPAAAVHPAAPLAAAAATPLISAAPAEAPPLSVAFAEENVESSASFSHEEPFVMQDDDDEAEPITLDDMRVEPESAEADLAFPMPPAQQDAQPLDFSEVEENSQVLEAGDVQSQPEAEPLEIDPAMLADADEPEALEIGFPEPAAASHNAAQANFAEEFVDDWLVAEPDAALPPPPPSAHDDPDEFKRKPK